MSMIDPKGSRESLEALALIRAHKLENQPRQISFIPAVGTSNNRADNPEESYG